ncbi:unnamed protein product [Boreogadus saida]
MKRRTVLILTPVLRLMKMMKMMKSPEYEKVTPTKISKWNFEVQLEGEGTYECSATGLVFEVSEQALVRYSVLSWFQFSEFLPDCWRPAGSIYDVDVVDKDSSVLKFIHFPHSLCLAEPEHELSFSVLHVKDRHPNFESTVDFTASHVKWRVSSLSCLGLILRSIQGCLLSIWNWKHRAIVLIYKELNKKDSIFQVYLGSNTDSEIQAIEEQVLKARKNGIKITKTYKHRLCCLEEKFYCLASEPEGQIEPTNLEFTTAVLGLKGFFEVRYSERRPSFKLFLKDPDWDKTLLEITIRDDDWLSEDKPGQSSHFMKTPFVRADGEGTSDLQSSPRLSLEQIRIRLGACSISGAPPSSARSSPPAPSSESQPAGKATSSTTSSPPAPSSESQPAGKATSSTTSSPPAPSSESQPAGKATSSTTSSPPAPSSETQPAGKATSSTTSSPPAPSSETQPAGKATSSTTSSTPAPSSESQPAGKATSSTTSSPPAPSRATQAAGKATSSTTSSPPAPSSETQSAGKATSSTTSSTPAPSRATQAEVPNAVFDEEDEDLRSKVERWDTDPSAVIDEEDEGTSLTEDIASMSLMDRCEEEDCSDSEASAEIDEEDEEEMHFKSRCEKCKAAQQSPEYEKVTPTKISKWSFEVQLEGEGTYECSATGLVFEVSEQALVRYSVLSWFQFSEFLPDSWRPAGSVYDVDVVDKDSSVLKFIHFPHSLCLAEPMRDLSISVLHVKDRHANIESTVGFTASHVKWRVSSLSLLGLILSCIRSIYLWEHRAMVLIYKELNKKDFILQVYLGSNSTSELKAIEKQVLKARKNGIKITKKSKHRLCCLEEKFYCLASEPEGQIEPTNLEFTTAVLGLKGFFEVRYSERRPSFKLFLKDPDWDKTLLEITIRDDDWLSEDKPEVTSDLPSSPRLSLEHPAGHTTSSTTSSPPAPSRATQAERAEGMSELEELDVLHIGTKLLSTG